MNVFYLYISCFWNDSLHLEGPVEKSSAKLARVKNQILIAGRMRSRTEKKQWETVA